MVSSQGNLEGIPLSFSEKQSLCTDIKALNPSKLAMLIKIISEDNESIEPANDEIEVDLDALPTKTLRKLQTYIKSLVST